MREVIEQTWGWDEAWQQQDFERRFRAYDTSVIQSGDTAIGGLMTEGLPDSIYVHEIQLSPTYQSQGIGAAIIGQLKQRAARSGLAVTLSVVPANSRATKFYERLGFTIIAFEDPFYRMRFEAPD